MNEDQPFALNRFISFDVFFKNKTGSPIPDHLFFDKGTGIFYDPDVTADVKEEMDGILNSTRIGLVKVGWLPHDAPPVQIQNIPCNNNCQSFIFEPYYNNHAAISIETAKNYGITLVNGVYIPTYAIIKEGVYLEHTNGHPGTGIPLITSHFALQRTLNETQIDRNWLFEIPDGIMKCRVYVWIEGQDIDSLETWSRGVPIEIAINFVKDTAGYE